MSKDPARQPRVSSVKGALLMAGALAVLITYPIGVLWTLMVTQGTGAKVFTRFGYALGWPLITFISLVDEARKHLPQPLN